ncbi:fibrillin-2-like [Anneissia japonica]|uniref:fibrillin-2-like n=1 Tax=Anneissia japonica TaxID=1529436 RepID=UPI0014256C1D|nr:fibrillin-2-like [Anneissia japonica]
MKTLETYSTLTYYRSSTSTSCGWLWQDRCTSYRTRSRYSLAQRLVSYPIPVCCEGYEAPIGSDECTEPICSPGCVNGICVGPNVCTCFVGYHGPTCEYTCNVEIDNCEIIDCTSSLNFMCTKCLYHINDEIKAYELVNGRCDQICSWRNDSRSCYPGRCASSSNNCTCDTDFTLDDNCMKIAVPPDVSNCSIMLQHDNGFNGISTSNISCQQSRVSPIYSSVKGNSFSVDWQTQFSATEYPFPYYVKNFSVGVTSAVVKWYIYRGEY